MGRTVQETVTIEVEIYVNKLSIASTGFLIVCGQIQEGFRQHFNNNF